MSLINRLTGVEEKLPVHQFYAALAEYADGQITKANIVSYFGLSAGDEADLDWLIARYGDATDKQKFLEVTHRIFILAEGEAPGYTTEAALQARIVAEAV